MAGRGQIEGERAGLRLLGQQPALNGVRAVAVGAVMAFHTGAQRFGGGYFGVDVFFVLSGFLITSLLLAEYETAGRMDFKAFYSRRALRLLPALVVFVAVTTVIGLTVRNLPQANDIGRDATATLLYSANWVYGLLRRFEVHLLSHTWSLSIEEQFYLLWPLILTGVLLWSRRRRSLVIGFALAAFVVSNALRWWMYKAHWYGPRITYGTDTRAGALMLGCAAGLVYTWDLLPKGRIPRCVYRVLGAAGVIVLSWMILGPRYTQTAIIIHPGRVFGDGYVLIALASAAIIVWVVAEPTSVVARVLALRPIAWVGKVSYGLYLWHVPIDQVLTAHRLGLSKQGAEVVQLVVTFAVVAASWYFLEQPFLRMKRRFERRPERLRAQVSLTT